MIAVCALLLALGCENMRLFGGGVVLENTGTRVVVDIIQDIVVD